MEVYVSIKYDFYPDHPYRELSEKVEHIEIGVFSSLEAAKRSFEEPYDKSQEDSLNPTKIKWYDREDRSLAHDICGEYNDYYEGDVLIRKLTVNT